MKRRPPPRDEQIGLYKVTTTRRPATLEELLRRDEPLPRVRDWLEQLGRSIAAIRANRKTYSDAVRANAENCSLALTALHALLQEIDRGALCDIGTVALAIERSADLAEEWQRLLVNFALEHPVKAHAAISQTGKKNTAAHNAALSRAADEQALKAFQAWRNHPSRSTEMARYSIEVQLRKFRTVSAQSKKPPKRVRDRLGRLLREGKIK